MASPAVNVPAAAGAADGAAWGWTRGVGPVGVTAGWAVAGGVPSVGEARTGLAAVPCRVVDGCPAAGCAVEGCVAAPGVPTSVGVGRRGFCPWSGVALTATIARTLISIWIRFTTYLPEGV
jgi:hypothetical protein